MSGCKTIQSIKKPADRECSDHTDAERVPEPTFSKAIQRSANAIESFS